MPVKQKVQVAEVVRHEGPMVLPTKMSYENAIEVLQSRIQLESTDVQLNETVDCFPWDGALALSKALEAQFGLVLATATPGMFGPQPPQMISVKTGLNQTVSVPWGRFTLPGLGDGWVASGTCVGPNGGAIFRMTAAVKYKYGDVIRELFGRVQAICAKESIYRGQAITLSFKDKDDDWREIAEVDFMQLSGVPAIFNCDIEQAIETNILTPIRYSDKVREAKVPLKRGVLLAGEYGTGKTMTAAWVAREAVRNGWTFIYVPEVSELPNAYEFAKMFQPAVVFAEDVDRAAGLERTHMVNELLNTLDGITSKAVDIIVVLTSNHPESINEAMRRPGRIDVVMKIDLPRAEAVGRLLWFYGKDAMSVNADLSEASEMLSGQRPAVIRECIERAKLEAIARTGGESYQVQGRDLCAAATVLLGEQQLFRRKVDAVIDHGVAIADIMASRVHSRILPALKEMEYNIRDND